MRSRCSLLACVPPFCFDIGYFVAVDFPDIGGPAGEIQTYIVSISVILATIDAKDAHSGFSTAEYALGILIPAVFIVAAIVRKVANLTGFFPGALDGADLTQPLASES